MSTIAQSQSGSSIFGGFGVLADALPEMPSPPARPRLSSEAEARLRQIVDAHFNAVWRSLRGMGVPPGMVDDASQQVFWIAAQKIDAIAVGSELSFLFATARGVAANIRRGRARNPEVLDETALASHVDGAPGPEQLAASKEARQILDRFLEALPEDVRSVFVLFELEGLTMTSIAELLELPTGTVASRLRRAREEFHGAAKRFQAGGGRS